MHVRCPTPFAILLMAWRDQSGVFRFLTDADAAFPGISFPVQPLVNINEQLQKAAQGRVSNTTGRIVVEQRFSEHLAGFRDSEATLYVAVFDTKNVEQLAHVASATFAELIRPLPSGKNKVAYMKALQAFSGVLDDHLKAYETDDLEKLKPSTPRTDS